MSHPILSVYTSPGNAAAQWSVGEEHRLVCNHSDLPDAQIHGNVQYEIDATNQHVPPCLTLAGSYVTFPVTPLLSVDRGDFSVCAWIRTTRTGITKILDHRVEDSGTIQGWSFFIYQGRLGIQLAHPGVLSNGCTWFNYIYNWETASQFPIVADGTWHHVAVTIDRDEPNGGCWYVDGDLVGRQFNPTGRQGSLSHQIPLTLGKRSDSSGGHFPGSIGGVGLYHWALTPAEVAAIYAEETRDTVLTEAIGLPQPPSNSTPLPNCRTCQFYSTSSDPVVGCAVNPIYWSQWRRLRSLESTASERMIEAGLIPCHDYDPLTPEPIELTIEKLIGVWNYQVSILPRGFLQARTNSYRLHIFQHDSDRGLTGRYLIPNDNPSVFEFKVYESSRRGRPVLTIAQTHFNQAEPASSYYAVLTGRLDRDGLITGRFVDLDNNQGTFTFEKQ